MSEKAKQNAILREFATRPNMRLWRANVGVARYGDRVVRFGIKGQADLSGIVPVFPKCPSCGTVCKPVGARLEVEVKDDDGRLSKEQEAFGEIIRRLGGIHVVATSPDDVQRELEHIG